VQVSVVIDQHFGLLVVKPMQATGILSQRPLPGDGHREEEGVQARIIEALAQVTSGREQDALVIIWYAGELLSHRRTLPDPHATSQHHEIPHQRLKPSRQQVKVLPALREHNWRTAS
jgi:hypothetical protein